MPPDLIRGYHPLHLKKTRQKKGVSNHITHRTLF
jgi:hypothetical protein